MNSREYQRKDNKLSQQKIASNYKCWLAYLLVAFWVVSICGAGILLYDSVTKNSIISSGSRYAIQDTKQKILSELKEIEAIPEAVIDGFRLTGNLTLEAEESLKLLDNSSANKIKKLITSYALECTVSDLKIARMAKNWSLFFLLFNILSIPGLIVGLKYIGLN